MPWSPKAYIYHLLAITQLLALCHKTLENRQPNLADVLIVLSYNSMDQLKDIPEKVWNTIKFDL